ncbi:Tellurite resistance protein TerB [Pelagibacteraceae bacterium GOM-A1]|nr:Tellurite resistance protein TerB [Pelagibacteraceae bacterium GOM-A1]
MMFSLFKKDVEDKNDNDHLSLISIAALLIHSAKIDENFTEKEKNIIKKALTEMGADQKDLDKILEDAELKEKDSNQILEFTKEVKNKNIEEKKIVIEALWNIIYSDENADMYETNLMRRLSGLLYLDPKVVGDIKEKIKSNR